MICDFLTIEGKKLIIIHNHLFSCKKNKVKVKEYCCIILACILQAVKSLSPKHHIPTD
jgi:hypothetical protein